VLQQLVHSLTVKCPAGSIPETIRVDVSGLKVDEGIHVRDLELPSGVVTDADDDVLLVHVVLRPTGDEEAAGAESVSQPEVIKPERKEKDGNE
jgi:large subunit ribosomal protein L25